MRVHELAKKTNKESKEIINILKDKNIEVKNHMSTLTEEAVSIVEQTVATVKSEDKGVEKNIDKEIDKEIDKVIDKVIDKDKVIDTDKSTDKSIDKEIDHSADTAQKLEEANKASNITQVYNPQYSRANSKPTNNSNNNETRNNQQNTRTNNTQSTGQHNKAVSQNTTQNKPQSSTKPKKGVKSNSELFAEQSSQIKAQISAPINRNSTPGSAQNNRNTTPSTTQNNRNTPQGSTSNNRNTTPNNTSNNRNAAPSNTSNNRGNAQSGGSNNSNRNNAPSNGQPQNRNAGPNNGPNSRNNYSNSKNGNQNYRNNYNGRGKNNYQQNKPTSAPVVKEEVIKTIVIPETITIKTLAEKMKQQPSALVKKLLLQGTVVTINQEIEFEVAEEIALEFNYIVEAEVKIDVIAELLKEEEEDENALVSRPAVVCVMGHVDHGKTSLLDAIRQTKVIEKEAGGITQHIGAYVVNVSGAQKVTFLDTPGHEAFTAMRMRGAKSTDIAILVVAADDGVMPQTIEAINHAKAAGIEIIVAVNKMDKPSANIDKVKQELAEHELVAEDWGGSTIFVPVSAHTKEGIDELLEMILLTADILELKSNPKRNARGIVIEAKLDKGKGPVATILVQKGTLRVGDAIAVGSCHGKVRAMMDDKGRRVKEAGPSTPIEILGLNDVPNAGEVFVVTDNEKEARSFAETYISEGREKLLEDTKAKLSLDDLFTHIQAGSIKELGIIVKADVQGSVEAIKQSLVKLSNEEVVVKIIHGGVGAINESDVILASASNAIIIGFNVRPDITAKSIAEREKVDLRLYRVIYDAIEDVESAMKGMLDPIFQEKVLGHAQVRQTFKASGIGTIAGSYVLDGLFQRGCSVRVTRGKDLIFEGNLASLKRFKDDVKEVKSNYECGLVFEKFNDLEEDDMVEAYTMVEVPR
ncbi:MAG: translation initiation factor IF-2 [Lachnotalea sp.]